MNRVAAGCAAVAIFLSATRSQAEPSTGALVGAGLAMAPPTYVLGVTWHEGSHAIMARLVGAEVVGLHLLPGRDPRTGAFHFGRTDVRGLRTDGQRFAFYVAPKVTSLAILGGFAALMYAGGGPGDGAAWPGNHYGQLALTVLATGAWVDFAKDVLSFSKHNDVVKAMKLAGFVDEFERLPVRLVYAGVNLALATLVWRGYQRTFSVDPSAAARHSPVSLATLPIWHGAF